MKTITSTPTTTTTTTTYFEGNIKKGEKELETILLI